MADYVPPKQSLKEYEPPKPQLQGGGGGYQPARTGGGGGQIAIGLVMLIAGIGLSVAGTGRVFIGLMVVGVITLIKGIANAGK
jgi:hypothetical protein